MLYQTSILLDVLQNFKTGNVFFDTILISLCLSFFASFVNNLDFLNINLGIIFNIETYKSFFYRRNQICISGKIITKPALYSCIDIETKFSNNFRAIWHFIEQIIQNNKNFDNIYSVKEYPCKKLILYDSADDRRNRYNNDSSQSILFIVNQRGKFVLDKKKKIYAIVKCTNENLETKDKCIAKIEVVEIKIFSYVSKLYEISNFIKEKTEYYQTRIDNLRYNKLFIYDFSKIISHNNDSEIVWNEYAFESARSFENIFFHDKKMLLRKIDFFVNNKQWYSKHGIPHTLGIALSGLPGTGKTSIIKALSNKLQRQYCNYFTQQNKNNF